MKGLFCPWVSVWYFPPFKYVTGKINNDIFFYKEFFLDYWIQISYIPKNTNFTIVKNISVRKAGRKKKNKNWGEKKKAFWFDPLSCYAHIKSKRNHHISYIAVDIKCLIY